MKSSTSKTRSEDRFINPWRRYVGSFIPNWLLSRREVSAQAKLCYARLAQYAGQKGVAYPRQDTLAAELGVDTRTVRRYVAELREHGLIHVEDRRNKNFPNKYKFLDHRWQHEGDVIDDDDDSNSNPPGNGNHGTESSGGGLRTDLSSRKGGPQDNLVLSGQDNLVLSRRESEEETHSSEENHMVGATRSDRGRRTKKPEKGPPLPKTFEDVQNPPPLGSKQEGAAAGEEKEKRPISANRPKTQSAKARRAKLPKVIEEATERASAQVSANAQKRLEAAAKRELLKTNRESKGPRTPGTRALEGLWYDLVEEYLPEYRFAKWSARERRNAKELVEKYDLEIAQLALRYTVENWNGINERIFKGRSSHPTIGMVLKLHGTLVIEAQKWSQHAKTIAEWEEWSREHPYSLDAPGDLDDRYRRAKKELEALGSEA